MNPYLATILTLVIALAFLRLMDYFAHRGWIESKLSRKFIHIGTGPIFVLCWLMFPDVTISRYLAALVPLLITVQFLLVGTGIMKDDAAVQAMTRTGNPKEILRGPLFYGIMFVVLTIYILEGFPNRYHCSHDDVRRRWHCGYRRAARQISKVGLVAREKCGGFAERVRGRSLANSADLVHLCQPRYFPFPIRWVSTSHCVDRTWRYACRVPSVQGCG